MAEIPDTLPAQVQKEGHQKWLVLRIQSHMGPIQEGKTGKESGHLKLSLSSLHKVTDEITSELQAVILLPFSLLKPRFTVFFNSLYS